MNSFVTWIIIAVFYAPLHFMVPAGIVVLTMPAGSFRNKLVRYVLIECGLSMLVAFALAIWLAADNLKAAIMILLLSMFVPYLTLFLHRFVHSRQAGAD